MGIKWKEDYNVATQRGFGIAIGFVCGLLSIVVLEALATKGINWTAWIQAVGSIIAIFVAIGVSARQSSVTRGLQLSEWQRQREERDELRVDTLRTIEKSTVVIFQSYKKFFSLLIELTPRSKARVLKAFAESKVGLEISEEVLKNIPSHAFPGILIGRQVLNIRLVIGRINKIVDRIERNSEEFLDEELKNLKKQIDDFEGYIQEIKEFMDDYDGSLGVLREPDVNS